MRAELFPVAHTYLMQTTIATNAKIMCLAHWRRTPLATQAETRLAKRALSPIIKAHVRVVDMTCYNMLWLKLCGYLSRRLSKAKLSRTWT